MAPSSELHELQPGLQPHLRGTPGEGDEGRCQEQRQGRHWGFMQPLCTTENHKVQEESFTSAHPPSFTSKCEGVPSCCLVPVLLPNLLLLRGRFSACWSDQRINPKFNFLLFTQIRSILLRAAIKASTFCGPIYKDIRSSRNEDNLQTKG